MMDRYDAVIVGAGTAGLSAALMLGRSRRKTLVLDGGPPRNAPAHHAHGLFTRDGVPPGELLRLGKRDLEAYPSVEVREGVAVGASGVDGNFEVALDSGEAVRTRKLLLSSGVVDVMPDVPGFAGAWGRGIFHCPYCHGWEIRDRPIAVLADGPMVIHRVALIRNWSRDIIALTDGSETSGEDREKLKALGVPLYEQKVSRIEGDAEAGLLTGIVFENRETLAREALFANPPQRQRSELAEMLGCEIEYVEMAKSYVISTNSMTQETTVKGVFAAGDAGRPMQSLPTAVYSGTNAGAFMNYTLASGDVELELASSIAL